MRLAEVAGLLKSDLILDEDKPFKRLQPHAWRKLKTSGIERDVPLVGMSLWAAQRASEASESHFVFPKYCNENKASSNSASAALNKWLQRNINSEIVVHSLRHAMRDRLRHIECPVELIDQIGGWSRKGVGESYGNGYQVEQLHRWMAICY